MPNPKLISFVLLIFFNLLSPTLFSQNLKFKTYQVEQGLSNNSINVMANDPLGGIWIGTWDGLNYFDGKNFTVFGHQLDNPNSLAGNYVNAIVVDKYHQLWVWADPETISLKVGKHEFDNFHFDQRITNLGVDKNGEVLVKLMDHGTYIFKDHSFQKCKSCVFSPSEQKKQIPEAIAKDKLLYSAKDKKGNHWWGTLSQGLFYAPYHINDKEKNNIQQYKADPFNPYGLRSNEVTAVLEDVFGNVWLGLKDGGVSRVIKNSAQINHIFAHPVSHPELVNETVRAVNKQVNGTLWIGYYSSGIYYRENGQEEFSPLQYPQELADDNWKRIRAIFEDSNGTVWVGTYQGIFTVKDHRIDRIFHEKNENSFIKRNYGFAEDVENKRIWVASWGGAMLYDLSAERFVPFEGQDKIQDKHIRGVYFHDGKLYLTTEKNGVLIWENGEVSCFDNKNGLLDNSTYSVYKDEDTGNIWIGTHGGITIWDESKGSSTYITQNNGLLSDLVYSLHGHGDKVWISTTNGIGFIKKSDFTVRVLLPEEGWQSAEYSEGASFQTESGLLYFGGVNGLNYFHPNDLDLNQPNPILKLEMITENGSKDLQVAVKQIAIGDIAKDTILYRVLPHDPEWKYLPQSNLLTIDGLKDGNYLLEVKNRLDYESASVSVPFTINSPIYTKKYIYVLSGLLLSAVFLLFRQYQSKKVQQKLEKKIIQRTNLIAEQKKKLEEKNLALDLQNREIEAQRSRLLQLHNRQLHPDFEMDKFVDYLLRKVKSPLVDLKGVLEQASFRDPSVKVKALNTLAPLLNFTNDLESNTSINQLDPPSSSLTLLPDLFHSLNKDFEPTLAKYGIKYEYAENLSPDWVSLDVVRLKLFFQYLFKGLIKFLDKGSVLEIKLLSKGKLLQIQIITDSSTLKDSLSEYRQFNMYHQSARRMLNELQGKMTLEGIDGKVAIEVDIPYDLLAENQQLLENRHWKHLDLKVQVPEGKKVVLLYGKRHEADSLVKILDSSLYFLIIEHEIDMMSSALQTVNIDVLVIYNEKLTENVATLLNAIQLKDSFAAIPILYIYEFISPSFQEKLMDMGVNAFLKMPSSRAFINKTVKYLLKERKPAESSSLVDRVFDGKERAYPLSPNEKLMQEALIKIKRNFTATDFRIETLCEEMGISKMKLYRLFKELAGKAPSDIIIHLRLDMACELLQNSQMNISEVSYNCGFNDPKHFSKLFKKHFGTSPKNFQMQKNKILLTSH
ncbi:helix-turn-helix domain-containing protein [Anditalea andensis]|uniref:HTH araC/xylS-type domain-containing protein n=1 Tax=Anditalea andensis TaxID=1048983 RepID=A0A074KSV2_9BACT|nr:helix-turn-helix domain-containing protein [Anditalea andensis]KEO71999.1 hypothetical protein EL17_20215 [Anditalea andensis]